MKPSTFLTLTLLGAGALLASPLWAQNVAVSSAWVRAAVPGQQATGGYMTLTSPVPARLVGVRTPAAGVAEIHEMKMDGDVMRMRAITGLDLPAGQPVELRPGGHHLMLQALRAPLASGSKVTVTLVLEDAQGRRREQAAVLPVALQKPK